LRSKMKRKHSKGGEETAEKKGKKSQDGANKDLPKLNSQHGKHDPTEPKIVSLEEWLTARKELNEAEKQLTRMRDAVTKQRREMPWTEVATDYVFEKADKKGKVSKVKLSELFGTNDDLMVYHFMINPGHMGADKKSEDIAVSEGFCPTCSMWNDGLNGLLPHIRTRASLVAVGKAPAESLAKIKQLKQWDHDFVSSLHNDFNKDFVVERTEQEKSAGSPSAAYNFGSGWHPVDQLPGASFFHLDRKTGKIYRVYSAYARGMEVFNSIWSVFDCLPEGRNGWRPEHKHLYGDH